MKQWRLIGVDRSTGKGRMQLVNAATKEEAVKQAAGLNIVLSDVEQMAELGSPAESDKSKAGPSAPLFIALLVVSALAIMLGAAMMIQGIFAIREGPAITQQMFGIASFGMGAILILLGFACDVLRQIARDVRLIRITGR